MSLSGHNGRAETNLLSRTDDVMRDPERKWQHEAHGSRRELGGERHGKKIAGFAGVRAIGPARSCAKR